MWKTFLIYFEYLILVIFNKDYSLSEIYELTWKEFLRHMRMKPPENKWNLSIAKIVKQIAKKFFNGIIYSFRISNSFISWINSPFYDRWYSKLGSTIQ